MKLEDFWKHVAVGAEDECWLWLRGCDHVGYGLVHIDGKTRMAHRVAYSLQHGVAPPKGLCVCHSCDVRNCCNPAHLWVGTRKHNSQDMVRKGRHARTGAKNPIKGEDHCRAKLTKRKVLAIRASTETYRSLARRYGVSSVQIHRVCTRKAWKHVR
jgi:hypothetical protein